MIIIEGPDGAGKTTLVNSLLKEFDIPLHARASTSTGGPVENIAEWAKADLMTWPFQELSFYDRHPMFSEPFYGAFLRNYVDPWFGTDECSELAENMMSKGLIVYCIPPLEVVLENIKVEEQLEGVHEHIETLHDLYHRQMMSMAELFPKSVFHYDYTKGSIEFVQLMDAIVAHRSRDNRKKNGRIA